MCVCCCLLEILRAFVKQLERIFSPPMTALLVSEVRDETIQRHESPGGEHKEVGLPPTGASLKKSTTVLKVEGGREGIVHLCTALPSVWKTHSALMSAIISKPGKVCDTTGSIFAEVDID